MSKNEKEVQAKKPRRARTVTIESARTGKSKVIVVPAPDDFAREQVGGFVNFLKERGVVGLAVGFIIGLQAQTLMKQLVDSFLTPTLNLIMGQNIMSRKFVIATGGEPIEFTWGKFVYALVNFLFVVFAIYIIIKLFKLDKLDKPKK